LVDGGWKPNPYRTGVAFTCLHDACKATTADRGKSMTDVLFRSGMRYSMPGAGFPLPVNLAEWLAQATAPLGAPFSHEIVLAAQQLPLPHRDPTNRFSRRRL
jgi:hypothetical protein